MQAQDNLAIQPWDIVFIVDQSGSMFGTKPQSNTLLDGNRPATDPDNLRFEALRHSISWLGNFQAQQAERGIAMDLNVSVIYFGNNAESININSSIWTNFNFSLDEWNQNRNSILQKFTISQYTSEFNYNLGNTNFLAAFRQAISNFNNLTVSNVNDRIQTIVLLTDGEPCAPNETNWQDNECRTQADKENHMQSLNNYIDDNFGSTNQNVHVVAIDEGDEYWSRYEDTWRRITQEAIRLQSFEELAVTFNDILSNVATEDVMASSSSDALQLGINVPLEEPLYISPYQQEMTVTLFKNIEGSRLRIESPNGRISTDNPNVTVLGEDNNIETWLIKNPSPGDWTFYAEGANGQKDTRASLRMDLTRATFTTEIQSTGSMYTPFTYTLRIRDKNGQQLPQYNNAATEKFDIRGQVQINHSGDTVDVGTLRPDGQGDYIFSYVPQNRGAYSVSLNITSGRNDEITFHNTDKPDIIDIRPVSIQVNGISDSWVEDIPKTINVSLWDDQTDVTGNFTIQDFGLKFIDDTSQNCDSVGKEFDTSSAAVDVTIDEPAEYLVCVTLAIDDPLSDDASNKITIANNQYLEVATSNNRNSTVSVDEINLLKLEVLAPTSYPEGTVDTPTVSLKDRATFPEWIQFPNWLLPAPYWQPEDTTITLQIVDIESGQPIDLREVLPENELGTLFTTFHVYDNNSNDLVSDGTIRLEPTDNGAIWRTNVSDLPIGTYTVEIETTDQQLGSSTLAFSPSANRIAFNYDILSNSTTPIIIFLVMFLIPWVILSAIIILVYLSGIRPRLWKPNGSIQFYYEDEDNKEVRIKNSINLKSFNRNKFDIPLNLMPVVEPPLLRAQVISGWSANKANKIRLVLDINGENTSFELPQNGKQEIWSNGLGTKFFITYEGQSE